MRGDRVSGGYEAGFVISERHALAVAARLAETTWEKRVRLTYRETYDRNMGLVRAKVRRGVGFGGAKGYVVVAQTKAEAPFVERAVDSVVRQMFKQGDRVRSLAPLHRWGVAGWRPVGIEGLVISVESGGLYVAFDAEPFEAYSVGAWWFEVIEPEVVPAKMGG